jgi:superfamily II DNA/RNA helicase
MVILLNEGYDLNGTATPWKIPKTVIFIEGRTRVRHYAKYLRQLLLSYSRTNMSLQQYNVSTDDRQYYISNVVEEFTSHIALYDHEMRYIEFLNLDSSVRIMVTTNILGTGMNIPDVERVVLWNLPLDKTLDEEWQRVGRAGRTLGITAIAYLFLPYWLFNCQRLEPLATDDKDRPQA